MKEILLYSIIFDFTAEELINSIEEAKAQNIVLRINSNGGEVESSWGAIAKFREHAKKKKIKVDGVARSMAAHFLSYADDVEVLDVTSLTYHRASFPTFIERDPELMTEDRVNRLKEINDDLRAALEAKVDVEKFEKIGGVTMDELFSTDGIVDVTFTAEEAKEIGIANKINKITPEAIAEIESKTLKIAASSVGIDYKQPKEDKPSAKTPDKKPESKSTSNQNYKDMSIEALKLENSEVYKEVIEKGIAKEKDRVSAWMVFNDIDAEAVAEGIESGEELSQKATAEFTKKGMSAEALTKLEKESKGTVETEEEKEKKETPEEKKTLEEISAFEQDVNSSLGRKEKEEEKVS